MLIKYSNFSRKKKEEKEESSPIIKKFSMLIKS